MDTATDPAGSLVFGHALSAPISDGEMLSALPISRAGLPNRVITLTEPAAPLYGIESLDWEAARNKQAELYSREVKPVLEKHPSYRFAYFGMAPIPLAMHLGYLLGAWRNVDVFQAHHVTKSWKWGKDEPAARPKITVSGLPNDRVSAVGDAIVRISVSYAVAERETKSVVRDPICEIDIGVEKPGLDVLVAPQDIDELAALFRTALDKIVELRPNVRGVHVFASVPVGLAFKLGACVSPTIHPTVSIYQYLKASEPPYKLALCLQDRVESVIELSEGEIAKAGEFRTALAGELKRIQDLSRALGRKPKQSDLPWFHDVVGHDGAALCGRILKLAPLGDTPLPASGIDLGATSVPGEFRFDEGSRLWQLSDHFLISILRRFPTQSDFLRGCRMLLLHEGVHLQSHRLTEATAQEVGRFPNLLEEVDYQADVWAFLHEWALMKKDNSTSPSAPHEFFCQLVRTALGMFWAFDDTGSELNEIQVRRMNRYLIWHWQLLRLQRCTGLPEVVNVLAEKPLIEIAGLALRTRRGRMFFSLDSSYFGELELGVLHAGIIHRHGQGPASRLGNVLEGFRKRDMERIHSALKGIFDSVVGRNEPTA